MLLRGEFFLKEIEKILTYEERNSPVVVLTETIDNKIFPYSIFAAIHKPG